MALVGALLQAPEELAETAALVRPEDLASPIARAVYDSIRYLAAGGGPVDPVLVLEDLKVRGLAKQVGGAAGLMAVAEAATSGANAPHYAQAVAAAARERRQREAISDAYLAIEGGDKPADVVAELRAGLEAAEARGNRGLEARPLADIIRACLSAEAPRPAISTGYGWLDMLHGGGLMPGDLTVIGGAPSVGKSQLLNNLEARMRRDGRPARILHVSLEMPERDITARLVALLGRLNITTTRTMLSGLAKDYTHEHYGRAFDAGTSSAAALPVRIVHGAFHPEDLAALAARYAGRIDVMAVDYLQRVSGEKGQKPLDRVAAAAKACKDIAMRHGVHVIALSSLNREGYRADAGRPGLASLRETGDIEFDADNVWLLWRKKEKGADREDLELAIEKQRNGPLDKVIFNYDLPVGEILEADRHRGGGDL
jgi:replicative DNA helicase